MSSITALALALASGGNVLATYAWPSASPRSPSVSRRQRFHRGNSSLAPLNREENAKFSFTNGVLSHGAHVVEHVIAQIGAPALQRAAWSSELTAAERRLGDVELLHRRREPQRLEVGGPRERRRELVQLRQRRLVIGDLGIAARHARQLRLGHLGLERKITRRHPRAAAVRRRPARRTSW